MADASGLSGDDLIVGTSGADKLIAGAGSDTVDGGAGSDFINAGGDNDTIIYDESDYKILGAGGIDTLWFTGYQQNLSLSGNRVGGIEKLLLGGSGEHQVWFSADDIIRISDIDQMQIIGNQTNRIYAGTGWSFSGLTTDGQSQILANGLAQLTVSLPVFVDGFSGNADLSITGEQLLTEDKNQPLLTAQGTVTITDPNAGQGLLLGVPSAVGSTIGTLSLTLNQSWSTNNPASYNYNYQISNDAVQRLGAGSSMVESFIIQTIDGSSKQLDFTTVGVNDSPVIQSLIQTTADIYELSSGDQGAGSIDDKFASGSFVVKDIDLGDNLRVDVMSVSSSPRGELTALISDSDADGNRTVNWIYKYTDAALGSLNSGETPTEEFTITISDSSNATITQSVAITLHGENDFTFDNSPAHFSITEISDGDSVLGENTFLHSASGSLPQSGATSVSWSADASNSPNLGNFTASLTENGQVVWTYSVNDKYLDYLRAGETVTQNFFVTVHDGVSTLSKPITITLNGMNDASEIIDPAGSGSTSISVRGSDQIARGLGGDDFFAVIGNSQRVYGDDGNDRFDISTTTNSLIRGGDGNDTFSIGNSSSSNEMYGDFGNDIFVFNSLSNQQIWGGPGSDTFRVLATSNSGSTPVLNDFDASSPTSGGDQIDLSGITGLNWTTLKLTESATVPNHYLLTAGEGLSKWTILTIVGTNLQLTDLTDGNLVGYPG